MAILDFVIIYSVFYLFQMSFAPLKLAKVVMPVFTPAKEVIRASPQGHLFNAMDFLKKGECAEAGGEIWSSASLQLKIFLKMHQLDANAYYMKDAIVCRYLAKYCTQDKNFMNNWDAAYWCHLNSYEDNERLTYKILRWMEQTVDFCNTLYSIEEDGKFDREHLKEVLKENGIKKLIDLSDKENFSVMKDV